MKSKKKKPIDKIKELQAKIAPLQGQIFKITESEELNIQLPRCRKMIGWCLKSIYDDYTYAKILAFIEPRKRYFATFILECIYVNKDGIASIQLNDVSPYLNKEWWDEEIPMNGWKRINEVEYESAKAKVWQELNTQSILKKRISKYK